MESVVVLVLSTIFLVLVYPIKTRRFRRILFVLALSGSAAPVCGSQSGARAASECLAELAAVPMAASVTIDLREVVPGMVDKVGTGPYWDDVVVLETSCHPTPELPGQAYFMPPSLPSPRPVKAVQLPGLSGMVFAYEAQGEEELVTGVAAALVEYRSDGSPWRAYKLAEGVRFEGWGRLVRSELSKGLVRQCAREVEYFTYNEFGDIADERRSPYLSSERCEYVMRFLVE